MRRGCYDCWGLLDVYNHFVCTVVFKWLVWLDDWELLNEKVPQSSSWASILASFVESFLHSSHPQTLQF